jgi:hypothetical protein
MSVRQVIFKAAAMSTGGHESSVASQRHGAQMTIQRDWEDLIEALRDELLEYGELLSQLDEQESAIIEGETGRFRVVEEAISLQLSGTAARKSWREQITRSIAEALGQPPDSQLRGLIDRYAEAERPLLHALLNETSRLVLRTKMRAHQNQMLLAGFRQIDSDRGTACAFM